MPTQVETQLDERTRLVWERLRLVSEVDPERLVEIPLTEYLPDDLLELRIETL
jgi:hypothetical protein